MRHGISDDFSSKLVSPVSAALGDLIRIPPVPSCLTVGYAGAAFRFNQRACAVREIDCVGAHAALHTLAPAA
jgi:hypothetical protein